MRIYNTNIEINSLGFGLGLSKKLFGDFEGGLNYNYAQFNFDQAKDPSFEAGFNTPKHRVKVSFGNEKLFENFESVYKERFFDETGIIGGFGFLLFVFETLIILGRKIQQNPHNVYYQAAFWAFAALMCHGMVDTGITNRNALQSISAILGMAFASEYSYK